MYLIDKLLKPIHLVAYLEDFIVIVFEITFIIIVPLEHFHHKVLLVSVMVLVLVYFEKKDISDHCESFLKIISPLQDRVKLKYGVVRDFQLLNYMAFLHLVKHLSVINSE